MSDMPTPRTDEAWIDPETGLMLNSDVAGLIRMMFVSRQLERELAEAKAQLEKVRGFLNDEKRAHFNNVETERGLKSALRSQLTAHKAALEKANTALLAITSSRFYQSSCRGGEMERLMNQAIEALKGNQ